MALLEAVHYLSKQVILVCKCFLANILCGLPDVCQPGRIQLVTNMQHQSLSLATGTVQVCLNGVWSYVCGREWSSEDAVVTCKQLGFPFTRKDEIIRYITSPM